MQKWILTSSSPEETRRFGRCLGELLEGGEIIALRGDLGAGKTCLTQGLAAGLGVAEGETVSSPSYTLLNPYRGRFPLYHFDLYRLMESDDLEDVGFFDYVGGEGVSVVEWADRIEGWASESLDIKLDYAGEDRRQITLQSSDPIHCILLKRLHDRWTEGGKNMTEFDIAIIGGGPGGYVAAIRAAQQGACVCLIERDKVGGTCLNRGCIPTKALYSTALLKQRLAGAEKHGISIGEVGFDYAVAAGRKDEVVEKLVGGIEQLLKGHKVDIFRGQASLEGEGRIRIRRPEVTGHIRAKKIILASGSLAARPKALKIDGKNVLTSNEILAIKELPESLLVIGGGYIGCEFASILSTLGTKVTIVEQLPNLLARTDRQLVREVEKAFKEQGVEIHTDTSVEDLEVGEGQVTARLSGGKEMTVEKVLVSVGRIPNIEGLGLEESGVEIRDGAVVVDETMRTSVENIYAIGDVTNVIQLAHVASYQAGIAVTNALGGDARADYRVVPSTIFTLPEIGQVGLTESDCKEKEISFEVGRFSYQASSKAMCDGETRGLVKILADPEDGRILGASIVGEEASALIAEVAAAMQAGLSVTELGHTIHSHPTLPEMIMEAAEDVTGEAVHKMGRKKR